MFSFEIALRRMFRTFRNALPGPTTASRLMRQSGHWRHLPPHQRAAAYAQFVQTQQQLHQHHVRQKIVPKLIDLLFIGLKSHLAAPLGQLILLYLLGCLIGLW
jgi:MoxR-like ATPase